MHLWNDIEGQTLAGLFPLERLLRTEGRSAFFKTQDGSGAPAVIRVTEALNDQQQMFARYRAIKATAHGHLVQIKAFGETEYEGAPLIYLVLEATQESLADILAERALTVEETNDVASSIVGAVASLHANGLVHGHLEPASVLAAGEVIKLRSDCVRQAPEGEDGTRARSEDVLAVADVLHRSLTRQRLYGASDALALPEPYASIVRNCWRGSWGIEEVAAELRRVKRTVPAMVEVAELEPVPIVYPAEIAAEPAAEGAGVMAGAEIAEAAPAVTAVAAPVVWEERETEAAPVASTMPGAVMSTESSGSVTYAAEAAGVNGRGAAAQVEESHSEPQRPLSSRAGVQPNGRGRRPASGELSSITMDGNPQLPLLYAPVSEGDELAGESRWHQPEAEESHPLMWVAGAAGVLLLVLLVWHYAGASRKGQSAAPAVKAGASGTLAAPRPSAGGSLAEPTLTPQPVPTSQPALAAPAAAPTPTPTLTTHAPVLRVPAAPYRTPPPPPAASARASAPRTRALAATKPVDGEVWRVIAYTYKQESQAQAKARLIAQRHPALHPQVYSRTGRGPYLVTLGGSMTRQQAEAMRQKARGQGLAHDVYVQNYSR